MSFDAIEEEISTWDSASLRRLHALIVSLRLRRDEPDFPKRMAGKIDDQRPENWVTHEEFGRELGLSPEAPRDL